MNITNHDQTKFWYSHQFLLICGYWTQSKLWAVNLWMESTGRIETLNKLPVPI